jgi:alanine racemase
MAHCATISRKLRAHAGRIFMNLTFVDSADIPEAKVGDEVIIIGTDGGRTITASDNVTFRDKCRGDTSTAES